MKALKIIYFFLSLLIISSCNKDQTTCPSNNMKLVEGTWAGKLDTDSLFLTFIEGEFEGSPTLSGSGFISNPINATSYIIMNGSHDRQKNIYFSLYKYPVLGKEDFQLNGILINNRINGTFSKYDQTGKIINTGDWSVKTWYQ